MHWGKVGNTYLDFPIYNPLNVGASYGSDGSVVYWNNLVKPDIQAFLCDSFMIKHLFDTKYKEGKTITKYMEADNLVGKKLLYFPFDSGEVYDDAKPVLENMDILVAMSKFSQKVAKKEYPDREIHYIPHGVDTNMYRPIPESRINALRTQNKWDKDTFIIGCVARNSGRKMLTRLIDAFKIFSKNKKNVVLFFHSHPNDPAGYNLGTYAKKNGIKNVVFSGMASPHMGVSIAQINDIYNMMDIHVLPTTGEGFGLPIIESMVCGVPNICTDCTTARELISGHGEVAKVADYLVGDKLTMRALVDVNDLAKKMDKLYYDKKLRERYAQSGRKFVLNNYTWEKAVRGWLELFDFGEIREKFI